MSNDSPTFVIADGGLPSMVAAVLCAVRQEASGGLVIWHPRFDPGSARAGAVAALAQRLRAVVAPGSEKPGEATRMLLGAAMDAMRAGAERVVWGVHLGWGRDWAGEPGGDGGGPELDRLATEIDRSVLISRLVSLEGSAGARGVRIDTPVIDLSDAQLADLALDLAVPTDLCWFERPEAAGDPAADAERRRWSAVLAEFGGVQAAG